MHDTPSIPPAIEQQAFSTIDAMRERGFNQPNKLTITCKQVATVILAKWDNADHKWIRTLTNRMVAHVYEKDGV